MKYFVRNKFGLREYNYDLSKKFFYPSYHEQFRGQKVWARCLNSYWEVLNNYLNNVPTHLRSVNPNFYNSMHSNLVKYSNQKRLEYFQKS